MPLDQSVGELPLAVRELAAVLLEPRPFRAKPPQLLPLSLEGGDAGLQLLDWSLVLARWHGADLGGAHSHRVARLPVDRMWKVQGNSRNVGANFPPRRVEKPWACGFL